MRTLEQLRAEMHRCKQEYDDALETCERKERQGTLGSGDLAEEYYWRHRYRTAIDNFKTAESIAEVKRFRAKHDQPGIASPNAMTMAFISAYSNAHNKE